MTDSAKHLNALTAQIALLTQALQAQNDRLMQLIDQNTIMLDMLVQVTDQTDEGQDRPQYLNG